MKYKKYLDFLLDVGIRYQIYRRIPLIFFANCIGGSCKAIIKDLDFLINKPIEKFNRKDLAGIWWVIDKVKGGKNNERRN